MRRPGVVLLTCATVLAGCAGGDESEAALSAADGETVPVAPSFGPADGSDLPPTDLDRVQVGMSAPDFTLASLAGPPVTLSDFRGQKNVVLVFYRGHW